MEIETSAKIIFVLVILFVVVPSLIGIFPIKFIKTTENGQHTGIVTAVETNGFIWKTDKIFFKTDVQSSQEDDYCVIDDFVKKQLEEYQISKKIVTIYYDDYLIVGYPYCKGEGAIVIGVEEVE